jgi:FAD/FMN-containing dehydrogenase
MIQDAVEARAGLVETFTRELGSGGVLTGEDVAARSCDPFVHVPPASAAILRPRSTAEVASILAQSHRAGQKIVLHGGRTGVSGGAMADESELVLSLERMNRIVEVDPVGGTMTVEAGVALETVQDAAAAHDLFYPIDLGSKGSATVGGTIATNAGGNRVIRWGMTRQNVLGLEAVLSDGTVLDLQNRFLKNNSGYDLKQLFIGSEGTLGVICKAVLRLVPKPRTQHVALVSVDRFDQVLDLLARARAMQQLSAFEVMWQDYYAIISADPTRRLVELNPAFYVLIEAMGHDEAGDEAVFSALLERAFADGLLVDAVLSRSSKQAEDIWRVREGSDMLVREMAPFISFDISVDIRRADEFVSAVRAALAETFGVYRSIAFGHLGDSNLHIGVHVGPDTRSREREIEQCVYDVLRRFSGALTAEHGIGTSKRDFLPQHISPAALATMRQVRRALDPDGMINGNVLF